MGQVGWGILDPGSWIQDPGSWILDAGSWVLDPGSRIWDPGPWILGLTPHYPSSGGCGVGKRHRCPWALPAFFQHHISVGAGIKLTEHIIANAGFYYVPKSTSTGPYLQPGGPAIGKVIESNSLLGGQMGLSFDF